MGRYGGVRGFNSAPGVFTVIWRHPLAKYLGAVALLIPLVIYMYYVVVEAWCLGYALQYLQGDLTVGTGGKVDQVLQQVQQASPTLSIQEATQQAYSKLFADFTGQAADGSVFQSGQTPLLWILVFTFAVNFFFIYRGVTRGIETFCKFAMPVMVLCAVCVLIRVLTLGTPDPVNHPEQSVLNGLGAMWNPQPEKLKDPQTWLAAAGQIFFSLSVGFGIIINYASYLRQEDDIALSGLTASSMNEFFEVCLGGLITLPAAFIFLGALAVTFGTFGMGFVALPNVFGLMPAGRIFGFVWFFMLFLAAITSSLSMLQPVIAFFEEGFGLKRHASAALLGLLAAMGCGFVLYFSKGATAMDTFDFWVGSVLIFVLAMAQAILYGWVFGIERGERELHEGAHIRVPRLVQWVLKFVTPMYLLAIFVMFCWNNVPGYAKDIVDNPVVLSSLLFIGTVLVFLLLLVHIAGRRWEREGRFAHLDNDVPPAP
jgi:SNF family Na+-dependent transporter